MSVGNLSGVYNFYTMAVTTATMVSIYLSLFLIRMRALVFYE